MTFLLFPHNFLVINHRIIILHTYTHTAVYEVKNDS